MGFVLMDLFDKWVYSFYNGGVDTQFCTQDLIKEDDWSNHPYTKKKKSFLHYMHHLSLHHMYQFVLALHALIHS